MRPQFPGRELNPGLQRQRERYHHATGPGARREHSAGSCLALAARETGPGGSTSRSPRLPTRFWRGAARRPCRGSTQSPLPRPTKVAIERPEAGSYKEGDRDATSAVPSRSPAPRSPPRVSPSEFWIKCQTAREKCRLVFPARLLGARTQPSLLSRRTAGRGARPARPRAPELPRDLRGFVRSLLRRHFGRSRRLAPPDFRKKSTSAESIGILAVGARREEPQLEESGPGCLALARGALLLASKKTKGSGLGGSLVEGRPAGSSMRRSPASRTSRGVCGAALALAKSLHYG